MTNKRKQMIFWIVYLAYTSIYMARVNLSMAGPDMISENLLDTIQLGFIGRTIYPALYKLFSSNEHSITSVGFLICLISAIVLCFSGVGMIISVISMIVIWIHSRENA